MDEDECGALVELCPEKLEAGVAGVDAEVVGEGCGIALSLKGGSTAERMLLADISDNQCSALR
ncbi:hypothetical protein GCM10022221_27730 [Actinocorallia aurea]